MKVPIGRWFLAFDGGCARCRGLSRTVQQASGGRLEVLPLTDARVQEWTALARPSRTVRRTPSLFRIDGEREQMWTGPALQLRLLRHLGPRGSARVLRALGASRTPEPRGDTTGGHGTSRRRFLQLGVGSAMAVGIMVSGAIPAAADPVAVWVKAHLDRLPRTYRALVLLPLQYRCAVYQELTPEERSAAWVEHLQACRDALPDLTPEQAAVFDETLVIAADPANFTDDSPPPAAAPELTDRAIAAFGVALARAIFATLGPDEEGDPASPDATCECSTISDFCGGHCQQGGCSQISGCGFLYTYTCNGRCQ